jgi:hypothetical protein
LKAEISKSFFAKSFLFFSSGWAYFEVVEEKISRNQLQ